MRETEEQGHQRHAGDLRLEPNGQPRLEEPAKKEFLDQTHLEKEPREAERQPDRKLARGKLTVANRRGGGAGEILKEDKKRAENEDDEKMVAGHRSKPGQLHSEIAPAVPEEDAKKRERNDN